MHATPDTGGSMPVKLDSRDWTRLFRWGAGGAIAACVSFGVAMYQLDEVRGDFSAFVSRYEQVVDEAADERDSLKERIQRREDNAYTDDDAALHRAQIDEKFDRTHELIRELANAQHQMQLQSTMDRGELRALIARLDRVLAKVDGEDGG